jgi:peptidyl-prolyl cis-trans isomerase A (cyclophilin A)
MLNIGMKNRTIFALPLLFCAIAAPALWAQQGAAALPDAPSTTAQIQAPVQPSGPTVVLDTTLGRITCKLFYNQAPVTSQNFIDLAEGKKDWTDPVTHKLMHHKPLYNGTTFHRVIPDFMAQGGDPSGTGMGDTGYYFNNEPTPTLTFNVPGRLAMANSGPNTNSSQFFITEVPVPELNGGYNLFGQCDDAGVAVVQAITHVQRDAQDKPLTPVVLKKVTIVREGQPMPPLPAINPAEQQPLPTPRPPNAATGK